MKALSFEAIRRAAGALQNRSPRVNAVMAAALALLGTLLLPTFLSDESIRFSNSVLSVIAAGLLFALLRGYLGKPHSGREIVLTHVFGLLLSFMTAAGRAVDQTGRFFPISLAMAASLLLFAHLFACGVSLLWEWLGRLEENRRTLRNPEGRLQRCAEFAAERPWLIALALLLCWLPCWLALFPGGFSYDMGNEFNQQFLIYKNDFPRLHTVLIIGFLNAAHALFGSYNAGIAIYAGVQMIAFSAMFTQMLVTFYRQRMNAWLLCAFAAYLAFFPVIPLTTVHTGRDTLFAGLLTYLGFLLYELARDSAAFLGTVRKPLLLGAVLSLTVLSRNNNSELLMLALLAVMNAVVWWKSHRSHSRGVSIFIVSNIAVFVTLSLLLSAICRPIVGTNLRASMSAVSQTLVRAYIEEPEKWTAEDKADFEYHINMENFRYCAECADYSKNLLQNIKGGGNAVRFAKLWLRMGVKCPGAYMNAMIAQTRYMWNPDSLIDGYVRAELYDSEKCYFTTGMDQPGKRISLWPAGERFYYHLGRDISFEKIPVLSMLFSIGFHYWLVLNCLFYAVYRRRKRLLLPLGAMLVYLGFCFFIPLVLMRYFMALFLFFPLTAAMTVHHLPPEDRAAAAGQKPQPTTEGA